MSDPLFSEEELEAARVLFSREATFMMGAAAIDGLKRCMADVHGMAPDIRYTLEDWAANDDIVWVRAVGRGTQTGPFFGPPSGTPFELTVIDVARIEGGRIAEHWGVPDRFALLAQTGRLEQLAAARFE